MRQLTAQENMFVQKYVNTKDPYKAGVAAGHDKRVALRVGRQMLKDPDIRLAINDEIDKSAVKTKLSRDWVLEKAKKMYEKCSLDNFSVEEIAELKLKFNSKDALGALALINVLLTKLEESTNNDKPSATINLNIKKDDGTDFKLM